MANTFRGKVGSFRDTFRLGNKDILQWFPGHMGKGIKQMEKNLKNVDCLIEVHDARIPVSGRYADFKKTLCGLKPHIFVLNKIDLADKTYMIPAINRLNKEGIKNIIHTNLKSGICKETKTILPLLKQLINKSDRFNRHEEKDFCIMVIGVPNVGKSSLINRLRNTYLFKPKSAPVGAVAGITKSVMNKIKISENPLIYLLDTPGILPPCIQDISSGLKLALVGCFKDHLVGPELLADYLLFLLNKYQRHEYVEKFNLQGPTDDILELLIPITIRLKKIRKIKNCYGQSNETPDLHYAAEYFIRMFRKGELGLYCLDKDILESF